MQATNQTLIVQTIGWSIESVILIKIISVSKLGCGK